MKEERFKKVVERDQSLDLLVIYFCFFIVYSIQIPLMSKYDDFSSGGIIALGWTIVIFIIFYFSTREVHWVKIK